MNPQQKLKTVSVLPAASPQEILRILAGQVQSPERSQTGQPAKVTLYLSGASFSGFVAGIHDEGEAGYILFVEHDDARSQSINVIYLPVWAITAVKVHDADQLLHLLSGGKVETQKATIGIAALRQKIADEILRLRSILQVDIKLEVSWETLSQDELSLLGLYELIDSFMSVVQEAIADEFKAIMFKSLVVVIRFQNAQEAEFVQEGFVLIVRANLKERSKGRFSREEFKNALETVLADT